MIFKIRTTTQDRKLNSISVYTGQSGGDRQGPEAATEAETSDQSAHSGEDEREDEEELLLSPAGSLASLRRRAAAEGVAMAGTTILAN